LIQSPISWVGGKRQLREKIIERIPEHTCYVEVFAGAGWVLFGKEPSKSEVLNDINGELINFWMQAQLNPEGFIALAEKLLVSREIFEIFLKTPPDLLQELPRAVRFYYIIKNSFGSRCENFGTATERRPRFNLETLQERIWEAHKRLKAVKIERLDFARLMKSYDRPHTFFYLDPPYCLPGKYYEYGFEQDDHERLAECLRKAKGKWMLSYNDCPEVRKLYKGFSIEELKIKYSIRGPGKRTTKTELLIRNY